MSQITVQAALIINHHTLSLVHGAMQRYDFAIARAVARLNVLAELCLPFVRPGGHWIAMKGPNPQVISSKAMHASLPGQQCGSGIIIRLHP